MNDQRQKTISMMGDRAYRMHLSLELNATRVYLPGNLGFKGYDLADVFDCLI